MSLKILTYAAAAAAVLALAVGVGVMAAFTLGSDGGGSSEIVKPKQVEGENPERDSRSQENAGEASGAPGDTGEEASDAPGDASYSKDLAVIQKQAVEASFQSNGKLLRYDGITAEDVEEMEEDYVALQGYARRAGDLTPPAKYEDQHEVFVLAIGELRDADGLAYRLAADPSFATQTDFEAYDRHMDRATAYLRRSNEMLGEDYKTTAAAQDVSL